MTDGLENLNNIFKSNHAYDQNGKEYNKETLEGQCTKTRKEFKESSTQVVSETDPNKSLSFISSHSNTTSDLTTALKELIPLRNLEDDYRRFYPFKSISFQSRLLDSESSFCKLIENNFQKIKEVHQNQRIRLHMHSDNNSCFYCIQLLHYFAKKWSHATGIPWLIMVSSHKEYMWKGVLPPGFDALHKKSMRSYANDDRYDKELNEEEIQKYLYAPGKEGKIIQIFLP
ncbi:MAG: hypothetical protein FADNKDHG_01620 [Holosporales bacterium]